MSVANPYRETHYTKTVSGSDLAVLVFLKHPEPGACKTRLAASLGARRAARIYRAMAEHAVAHAQRAVPGRVWLLCSPDTRHPFFGRLARRYGARRIRQARGDLGQRMHQALAQALASHPRAVLIGSDQPDLADGALSDAAAHLGPDCPAWLAPTVDGGYWGIGLTRPASALFHGPAWSTPRVVAHTRTSLRRARLDWREYTARRDIDDARDWHRLDCGLRARLSADAVRPAQSPRTIPGVGSVDDS